MSKQLEDANKILAVQGDKGNWDYDPYMHGLYNGMEMIVAIFEDREPKFKKAPKQWLADLKTKNASNLGQATQSEETE